MAGDEAKVMVQFGYTGDPPEPLAVAARFGIEESDLDPDFGVIVTDEEAKLATVLVPPDIAHRMRALLGTRAAEGTYSNPRIAPFGPPETDEDGAA